MTQYHERINSITSKSCKLKRLICEKTPESERKQLHLGLEYSFVDKPKQLKKNIAANFETVSQRASKSINHDQLEDFHEFLRAYTDIFTKHIYATKDVT